MHPSFHDFQVYAHKVARTKKKTCILSKETLNTIHKYIKKPCAVSFFIRGAYHYYRKDTKLTPTEKKLLIYATQISPDQAIPADIDLFEYNFSRRSAKHIMSAILRSRPLAKGFREQLERGVAYSGNLIRTVERQLNVIRPFFGRMDFLTLMQDKLSAVETHTTPSKMRKHYWTKISRTEFKEIHESDNREIYLFD